MKIVLFCGIDFYNLKLCAVCNNDPNLMSHTTFNNYCKCMRYELQWAIVLISSDVSCAAEILGLTVDNDIQHQRHSHQTVHHSKVRNYSNAQRSEMFLSDGLYVIASVSVFYFIFSSNLHWCDVDTWTVNVPTNEKSEWAIT